MQHITTGHQDLQFICSQRSWGYQNLGPTKSLTDDSDKEMSGLHSVKTTDNEWWSVNCKGHSIWFIFSHSKTSNHSGSPATSKEASTILCLFIHNVKVLPLMINPPYHLIILKFILTFFGVTFFYFVHGKLRGQD